MEGTAVKYTYATSRALGLITLLAILIPILCGAASSQTAIGDHVELKATHEAGVPFHSAPGSTNVFQRIPDGTPANRVIILFTSVRM
jgi:hypothetical protein